MEPYNLKTYTTGTLGAFLAVMSIKPRDLDNGIGNPVIRYW